MTVAIETASIRYVGDGATARFPVPFAFTTGADLRLLVSGPAGFDRDLIPSQDFTVDQAQQSVELAAPLATGSVLAILRGLPLVQDTRWIENQPFYATTVERSFDRLVEMIQQQAERIDRAVLLPATSGARRRAFGPAVPNGILRWDGTADAVIADAVLGPALLGSRDQAVHAAVEAIQAAAEAAISAGAAATARAGAEQARSVATAASVTATMAAGQATAARDTAVSVADRAGFGLGLMGLANNLTQLLYTILPFLGDRAGIFRDNGWVTQAPIITGELGWACPPGEGILVDWGQVAAANELALDFGSLGPAGAVEDWGSILSPVDPPVLVSPCINDLGWVTALVPLDGQPPVTLPIRVPDPCPVLFPTHPDPDPRPSARPSDC